MEQETNWSKAKAQWKAQIQALFAQIPKELHLSDRAQAALFAARHGLISLD